MRREDPGSLPPALPPEAVPVEAEATAGDRLRPTKAGTTAMLFAVAVQLLWIVALVYWIVRVVW
jgi:hypothetical protein